MISADPFCHRLGDNAHTLLALHSFLLDRFNAADYDGSLIMSILRVRQHSDIVITSIDVSAASSQVHYCRQRDP